MNNLITNMYVENKSSAGNDNELIDISSDDTDNEDSDSPGKKKKIPNAFKAGDSKLISYFIFNLIG